MGFRFARDRSLTSVVKSRKVNLLVQRLRENRPTAIVVALLLILVATVAWNLWSPRGDPRLDAIRRQGYPVTLSELNAWYKPVPKAQNNARMYEEAFALPDFESYPEVAWLDQGGAL